MMRLNFIFDLEFFFLGIFKGNEQKKEF